LQCQFRNIITIYNATYIIGKVHICAGV